MQRHVGDSNLFSMQATLQHKTLLQRLLQCAVDILHSTACEYGNYAQIYVVVTMGVDTS